MKDPQNIIATAIDECMAGPSTDKSRFTANQIARVIIRKLWQNGYTIELEGYKDDDRN